jgi:PAS domain S-box-containing protein
MSQPEAHRLISELAEPFTGEILFDDVPDATWFIKDEAGRYVVVNQELVRRTGRTGKHELLGRTAAEVFAGPLGESYLEQDLRLIAGGEPLHNELELHIYTSGEPGWCLTTKQPLKDRAGRIIGLVGISRDVRATTDDFDDVAAALREVRSRLAHPWTVDEVARLANLSAYQLDRRLREVFHLTTNQLVLKYRMDRAAERLRGTDRPIVEIALECGYSDQSAFTRVFRRTTGLTPGDFRRLG